MCVCVCVCVDVCVCVCVHNSVCSVCVHRCPIHTSTRHNLALVQSKLMAQNVSLHSLLRCGAGGRRGGGGGGEPRALPSSQ